MRVGDLIDRLSQYDPDDEVMIQDAEEGVTDFFRVNKAWIRDHGGWTEMNRHAFRVPREGDRFIVVIAT